MNKREMAKEIAFGLFLVGLLALGECGVVWAYRHHPPERPAVLVKCPACGAEVEVELKKKGGG